MRAKTFSLKNLFTLTRTRPASDTFFIGTHTYIIDKAIIKHIFVLVYRSNKNSGEGKDMCINSKTNSASPVREEILRTRIIGAEHATSSQGATSDIPLYSSRVICFLVWWIDAFSATSDQCNLFEEAGISKRSRLKGQNREILHRTPPLVLADNTVKLKGTKGNSYHPSVLDRPLHRIQFFWNTTTKTLHPPTLLPDNQQIGMRNAFLCNDACTTPDQTGAAEENKQSSEAHAVEKK